MTERDDTRQQREARAALEGARVVLVSACLLGAACRYDGTGRKASRLQQVLAGKEIIPVCPEAAAGLGTPRPAVQLSGGTGRDVWRGAAQALTVDGRADRTDAFRRGAHLALEAAQRHGVRVAILKERSPSCGSAAVRVDGALAEGEGITTALLRAHGLHVLSEADL